jgi:serine/threonine protein kinase
MMNSIESIPAIKQNIFSNYSCVGILGSGDDNMVYELHPKSSNPDPTVYAVKCPLSTAHSQTLLKEATIMSRIPKHQNIVQLSKIYLHRGKAHLFLECVKGGNLEGHGHFTEKMLSRVAFSVLTGLKHLHKNNVVHKDIKVTFRF